MVFPLVMYGCESWTIKKAEHWRTDAFELWCWRKLFLLFIYFDWRLITLQYCIGFAINQNESATGLHVFTIDKQCCDSFRGRAKGLGHTYTCIHSSPNNVMWQHGWEGSVDDHFSKMITPVTLRSYHSNYILTKSSPKKSEYQQNNLLGLYVPWNNLPLK